MGECKLTVLEMQLILLEAADVCKNKPNSLQWQIPKDGCYYILTLNCFLLGWSQNYLLPGSGTEEFGKMSH